MKKENRMKIKLMMIGELAVGKSSLTKRFTDKIFVQNIMGTAGLDMHKKVVKINDENINVIIYDSAGHERFRKITEVQYKGADGLILVYDITDKRSFEWIIEWIDKLKSENYSSMDILLIGNKIDLQEDRKICENDLIELGNLYNIPIIETSALTGQSVDEAFNKLINNIYHSKTLNIIKKQDDLELKINENGNESIKIDKNSNNKKKKGCCFK